MIKAFFSMLLVFASSAPSRVLAALGIGWLTFAGLSAAVDAAVTATFSAWSAMPASVYQLLSLGGATDALGIITAAMVTKAALAALPQLGKVI